MALKKGIMIKMLLVQLMKPFPRTVFHLIPGSTKRFPKRGVSLVNPCVWIDT